MSAHAKRASTPRDALNDRLGGATAKSSTMESRQIVLLSGSVHLSLTRKLTFPPYIRIRVGTMSTPCRTSCRVTKVEDAVEAEAGKQMQWTCRRSLRRQQAAFHGHSNHSLQACALLLRPFEVEEGRWLSCIPTHCSRTSMQHVNNHDHGLIHIGCLAIQCSYMFIL